MTGAGQSITFVLCGGKPQVPTIQIGKQSLPASELKADKKAAIKIGPVGMGKRALYLNSFYISRMYYVLWTEVSRVYKLVAMSKGGFTGIGAFGAMSYLVVELRDGRTRKCQIKYENQTDKALSWIAEHHPEIPTRSVAAQKKLDEKKLKESKRKIGTLDDQAQWSVQLLQDAKEYLEKRPDLYNNLSVKAGKKRVQQMVPTRNRILGTSIFVIALLLLATGIPLTLRSYPAGIYMVMFGAAFLLFSLAGNLIPIGRNSPKRIDREWQDAVQASENYISAWAPPVLASEGGNAVDSEQKAFPVPGRYAHPVVLERMIRVLQEGRAKDTEQALEVVKGDLKRMNKSVKVSQEEYDEVVVVKPMFLVSEYA